MALDFELMNLSGLCLVRHAQALKAALQERGWSSDCSTHIRPEKGNTVLELRAESGVRPAGTGLVAKVGVDIQLVAVSRGENIAPVVTGEHRAWWRSHASLDKHELTPSLQFCLGTDVAPEYFDWSWYSSLEDVLAHSRAPAALAQALDELLVP